MEEKKYMINFNRFILLFIVFIMSLYFLISNLMDWNLSLIIQNMLSLSILSISLVLIGWYFGERNYWS
jgi:hypothetical protein